MRETGHKASIGEKGRVQETLEGNTLKERERLEDQDVDRGT
jgi:hypothetical protein